MLGGIYYDVQQAGKSISKFGCMLQAGGYGKVITHVIIGLKSVKGTKQLKLDPTIYDSLQKEKVLPGDVIYIEANSGKQITVWLPAE